MSDWQKVELGDAWKYDKPGDAIEGAYVDKKEDIGPNNSIMYTLLKADGSHQDVWGSTVIDAQMSRVSLGSEVRIVFQGEKPSPNRPGKTYKDFEIFFRATPMTSAKLPLQDPVPEPEPELPQPEPEQDVSVEDFLG